MESVVRPNGTTKSKATLVNRNERNKKKKLNKKENKNKKENNNKNIFTARDYRTNKLISFVSMLGGLLHHLFRCMVRIFEG